MNARRVTVIALAGTLLVTGASGATAARPGAGGAAATFALSPAQGPAGTWVTARSVTACPGVATWVGLTFWADRKTAPVEGVGAATDSAGNWSVNFQVPPGTAVGPHRVEASCRSGPIGSGPWVSNYTPVAFRVTTS